MLIVQKTHWFFLCLTQKQKPANFTESSNVENSILKSVQKFRKFYRETPVLESFLIKLEAIRKLFDVLRGIKMEYWEEKG